jgi:hypothetical protein
MINFMKFMKGASDSDNCLCCPVCDFECLHQVSVKVFSRKEDEEVSTLTTVNNLTGESSSKRVPSDLGLSARRQSLSITFRCEQCHPLNNEHTFAISQHKGLTSMGWIS